MICPPKHKVASFHLREKVTSFYLREVVDRGGKTYCNAGCAGTLSVRMTILA